MTLRRNSSTGTFHPDEHNVMMHTNVLDRQAEIIKSMKEDFAKHAIKYDFSVANDGKNITLGYIGKSLEDAEWAVWKSANFDNVFDKEVEYICKSESFDKAEDTFRRHVTNNTSYNKPTDFINYLSDTVLPLK